jgi:hypothetical protein
MNNGSAIKSVGGWPFNHMKSELQLSLKQDLMSNVSGNAVPNGRVGIQPTRLRFYAQQQASKAVSTA